MRMTSLLAQFGLVQARIDSLVLAGQSPGTELNLLFRQAQELREKIITTPPESRHEAVSKLSCLLKLIQRDLEIYGIEQEMAPLLQAADDTCGALRRKIPGGGERGTAPPSAQPNLFGGSLAEYVTFAEGRVSLVDTDYRYTATSAANAAHFGLSQVHMMGAHLSDIIGEYRFKARMRPHIEACLQGQVQSYHFTEQDHGDTPLTLRCNMHPVRGPEGPMIGVLVYTDDVTDSLAITQESESVVAFPPILRRTS